MDKKTHWLDMAIDFSVVAVVACCALVALLILATLEGLWLLTKQPFKLMGLVK